MRESLPYTLAIFKEKYANSCVWDKSLNFKYLEAYNTIGPSHLFTFCSSALYLTPMNLIARNYVYKNYTLKYVVSFVITVVFKGIYRTFN